ncbi:MAG: twin-arginine translocase subunit TatC [Acidobacteria bacterium]|nr:twin-arginine translocase subunit TatC [Acidobacteriota bacterium]
MDDQKIEHEPEASGQMSFLEHLDELRKRLVKSVLILIGAFLICFNFSNDIYNFLSIPIRKALNEVQRRQLPVSGITGSESLRPINEIKEGDTGRYTISVDTSVGATVLPAGTSVGAEVTRDAEGKIGLFTTEPIFTNNAIVPKGVRLPLEYIDDIAKSQPNTDSRMTITTAPESFTLLVTVSLYAAIALALPLLLWQVWGFISPALYKHERSYVTPFIGLSTISFVVGAAFAYYILFPPAVNFLLNVGEGEFQFQLRATDYLDFITIIMLAMGLIFQMPAITYVLSRIGVVSARLLISSWKIALIVILIVAAVVSPTADVVNMMLFATPMMALYVVSIFIAWFFGKKRQTDAEVA